MSVRPLPLVVLQGSPRERGRQHGARFAAEVRAVLSRMQAEQTQAGFRAAWQRAEQAWPQIAGFAADVGEEIHGMADGANVDATALLLNIGFEYFAQSAAAATGCSAVAVAGHDGALVAQNWDASQGAIDELAVFLHLGPNGFEHAVVASIGGLSWVGCNRHGLAFVNNDLLMRRAGDGLPSQIVRRLMLAEPDVSSAIRRLASLRLMGGRSYLLGDWTGNVAAIEVSPTHGAKTVTQMSPAFHTNHALQPDIRMDEDEAALQRIYPSSRARYTALTRYGGALSGPQDIMTLLANEDGAPNAICKTVSVDEPTQTTFSVIFDCGRREIYLCAGAPSRNAYMRFGLPTR